MDPRFFQIVPSQWSVDECKRCIWSSIVGIELDRFLEIGNCLCNFVGIFTREMRPSLQKGIIRCGYARLLLANRQLLGRCELYCQGVGYAAGYFVLQRKYVAKRSVEPISPNIASAHGIDELCIDSNLLARALHSPFEHIAH